MTASTDHPPGASPAGTSEGPLRVGIVYFALYYLGLALFMAVSPRAFYEAIGPFGGFNAHYIRDVASFEAALGVGLAIAVRRPSWRVPALALSTVQFALHSVNHLIDVGDAHPAWVGYFDFASLAASTLLLLWLLRLASRERSSARSPLAEARGTTPIESARIRP